MATNAASVASHYDDALSRLAKALSSKARLLLPSEPAYHTVRLSWNEQLNSALPSVIIEVASTADVVCALSFARETGQQFTVSCGRHTKWSCQDGQVMISLGGMRAVTVDAARGVVELQGGALVADVDRECAVHQLHTALATTGDVGCGGLILGGGVGYLTRRLGASLDQLLALELVTHDGSVLQVSEKENAALFWGMKGAGFNFGIATRFTLRLHRVGHIVRPLTEADTAIGSQLGLPQQDKLEHRVLSGSLIYPLSMTDRILSKLDSSYIQPGCKGLGPYADRDLLLSVIVVNSKNGPACMISFTHVGDVYKGFAAMQTLIQDLGTPLTNTVRTVMFLELQQSVNAFLPAGHWHGVAVVADCITAALSTSVVSSFGELQSRPALHRSAIALIAYGGGGAMSDFVGNGAVSAAQRTGNWFIFIMANHDSTQADQPELLSWSLGTKERLLPHCTTQFTNSWNNEPDAKVLYAENLEQLRGLKRQYDPSNAFRNNQNITC